jgi:hypothetical protein
MTRFKYRMAAVLRLSDYRKRAVPLDCPLRTYSPIVRQRRKFPDVMTTETDADKLTPPPLVHQAITVSATTR